MDAYKFGCFVAERRKEQKMTQKDLAAKLQVTDKAVSKWERGLGFPDINSLEPLADALGVSIMELMKSEKIENDSNKEVEAVVNDVISVVNAEAEEKRKIEEERKAFAAEQQRVMEENRKKIEEEARIKAEEEVRKAEEEKAKKEAEEKAQKEAEEKAQKEAEAKEAARQEKISKWPSPKLSLDVKGGEKFTPDGDGRNDIVTFKPEVKYLEEPPESWALEITDPKGNLFRTISGSGNLPASIDWDGRSESGEVVVSRNVYKAKLTVVPSEKDRKRTGEMKAEVSEEIHTGLLLEVIVPGHEWKIVVQSIAFDPNAAGFKKVSKEQKLSNAQTLDEVADEIRELAKSGTEVNVIIEGYANNISGTEKEQKEELLPLSQKRAETIVNELIKRGIDPKLLTPKGLGGANPIASQEDQANWWKNRRVEFRINQ